MTTIAGFQIVSIVGGGQMGSGIAQVCATNGLKTILVDINPKQIETAKAGIASSLEKLASKNVITSEQKSAALANMTFASDLNALKDCDLVIEAIIENERIKTELFQSLDKITKSACILASNTSSIPITRLAAATSRPDKFIGMHFMNPVPLMKLVEIIPGIATAEETTKRIIDLSIGLGKALGKIKTKSEPYGHLVCTLSQSRCQSTLAPPATAAKISAPTSSFPPNRLALVAARLP